MKSFRLYKRDPKERCTTMRRFRLKRLSEGRCTCGKPLAEGRKRCVSCLRREARRAKRLKLEHKSAGFCSSCGREPVELPFVMCLGCRRRAREWNKKAKRTLFEAYGGARCACCGEEVLAFLTIDHINGGGRAAQAKTGRGGQRLYLWLRRNNYPSGFRVLCFNCNAGRAVNGGTCPHENA